MLTWQMTTPAPNTLHTSSNSSSICCVHRTYSKFATAPGAADAAPSHHQPHSSQARHHLSSHTTQTPSIHIAAARHTSALCYTHRCHQQLSPCQKNACLSAPCQPWTAACSISPNTSFQWLLGWHHVAGLGATGATECHPSSSQSPPLPASPQPPFPTHGGGGSR